MILETLFPRSESHIVLKPGQPLFNEGDPGDFMYVLVEGIADVRVQNHTVGTFEAVEVFGEMAVIDSAPRSATVVAKTTCRFARVTKGRFLVLVQHKPEFALHIMQMLVERMRWMDSVALTKNAEQAAERERLERENRELKAMLAATQSQAVPA